MKYFKVLIILIVFLFLTSCSKKPFEVTYMDGKEVLYIYKVDDQNRATEKVLDDQDGYYFWGWYKNLSDEFSFDFNSEITEDITLFAKWEPKEFTITFIDNDNRILKKDILKTNVTISPPASPTTKKIGNEVYTFTGWDQEFDKASSDLVIKAVYVVTIEFEVTFYDLNGIAIKKNIVNENHKAQAIEYQIDNTLRYDYDFIGWTTDKLNKIIFDFNDIIISDLHLYPVYTRISKTIDYNNMTVSFLGDSITTFYSPTSQVNSYYSGTNQFYYPLYSSTVKSVTDTWWFKFADMANLKLGVNNSWSGSSLYNNGSQTNSGAMNSHRINTLNENGNPDIIVIFIGTNDNVNGHSPIIFRQSLRTLYSRINTTYPNAFVFTMNLGYSAFTGYSYTESMRLIYNQIISEETIIFDQYLIDLASIQTASTFQTMLGDSLHPNANGMNEYARLAFETLKESFK